MGACAVGEKCTYQTLNEELYCFLSLLFCVSRLLCVGLRVVCVCVCVCVCVHSGRFVAWIGCAHTKTVARGIRLSSGFPPFWYQSMVTLSLVIAVDDRRG